LLDEVGDMSPSTQAKFLRLLQEGQFERLGGSETISVDVRVIAATNQDLDALIDQNRFRRDLFYRICGVTIHLPPLRNRAEDIPELSHYFLYRYNRELGTSVQTIDAETLELLQEYAWPGNIRELQSAIREALIVSAGSTLLPEFLPGKLHRAVVTTPESEAELISAPQSNWHSLQCFVESAMQAGEQDIYRRALEQFDRLILQQLLRLTDGNQVHAAAILGLSRPTLRAKMKSTKLAVTKVVSECDDV
jgi:two-component system nitrogen regulation response regulator GlnG